MDEIKFKTLRGFSLVLILNLCIILMVRSSNDYNIYKGGYTFPKYHGKDKHYYEPITRKVMKGLAQPLLLNHNSAVTYGAYGFDMDCEKYGWEKYYWQLRDAAKCTNVASAVYYFTDLKQCRMNLVYPVGKDKVPNIPWMSYVTPLYLRTRCLAPYDPVPSHLTVSEGPGWYIIRFPIQEIFMYMTDFRLIYRRVGDTKWVKPKWPGSIDLKYMVPRIKPAIPCPPWKGNSMYCIMVTDFIRTNDESHQDYEGMLQSQGVIWGGGHEFFPKNYRFIFRVHFCDITSSDDCTSMGGINVHEDRKHPPTMSPEEYSDQVAETEGKGKKKKVDPTWIALLALALILPLLLFLIAFLIAKRRTVRKARENWYHISAPDWPVHYTLRLPPNLRRRESATQMSDISGAEDEDKTITKFSVVSQKPQVAKPSN